MKKLPARQWIIVFIVILLVSGGFTLLQSLETDPIYKEVDKGPRTLAEYPVRQLITSINNGRFQLIDAYFTNSKLVESFFSDFAVSIGADQVTGGFFEEFCPAIEILRSIPQAKGSHPDYLITIEFRYLKESLRSEFVSRYDDISKKYLISEMRLSQKPYGKNSSRTKELEIPQVSESACVEASSLGYQYVLLKHRNEDDEVIESKTLGDSPHSQEREVVPRDYYGTESISQVPFEPLTFTYENPKYIACRKISPKLVCDRLFDRYKTETYDAGNVLNFQDAMSLKIENIFGKIEDSDGLMEIEGVNFPTAFFVDSFYDRLTIITANNDLIYHEGNEFKITDPKRITVIGNHIYILNGGTVPRIIIIEFERDGGRIKIQEKEEVDFGLDLSGANDLAGFASDEQGVLFITNSKKGTLAKVPLDTETGLLATGRTIKVYRTYVDLKGQSVRFNSNTAIEANLQNSETGKCTILMVENPDKVLSFSTDAFLVDAPIELNFLHQFPWNGNVITNIGYNLGNRSFVATDLIQHKVHVFSEQGDYLGSGGRFGKNEGNSEFYYPNLVSSNTFSTDAIEMIVGSDWNYYTGFKRIFPRADLGRVEVIEKAPLASSEVANNALLFRYGLTAAYNLEKIEFYLNDVKVREIAAEDLTLPDMYAESFLVNTPGEDGLKEELKFGWNKFEIELTARSQGPQNIDASYKKRKRVEFYYTPSIIEGSFEISDSDTADIYHDYDNPFYLYKTTFIEGEGNLTIRNGKTVLMRGCSLVVNSERSLIAENEIFEFQCGSNLSIAAQEEVIKIFRGCTFDGSSENFNMISVTGDYTGGLGSGSAPSSVTEFVECTFNSYYGKALHVIEGRASLVNCDFTGLRGTNTSNTSVGVLVNPDARIDVRGGTFSENHIAVDGNLANLYIGHSASSYQGTKVKPTIFQENTIGVFSYGAYSEITHTTFRSHQAALVDIGGEVNVARNKVNLFQDNEYAILFTNELDGQSGKNQFINNINDIAYLPIEPGTEERSINLTCNYWEKGGTDETPVFKVLEDSLAEEELPDVSFVYIPFLERKGKSNFTCTGGDGNPSTYGRQTTDLNSSAYQPPVFLKEVQATETISELEGILSKNNKGISFGTYSKGYQHAVEEAVFKNDLLSKLYTATYSNSHIREVERGLSYIPPHTQDRFIPITKDKLELISTLEGTIKPYSVKGSKLQTRADLIIYPNPVVESTTIQLNVSDQGTYTIKVYDITGHEITTIIENQSLMPGYFDTEIELSGLLPGIYPVNCFDDAGKVLATFNLLKK